MIKSIIELLKNLINFNKCENDSNETEDIIQEFEEVVEDVDKNKPYKQIIENLISAIDQKNHNLFKDLYTFYQKTKYVKFIKKIDSEWIETPITNDAYKKERYGRIQYELNYYQKVFNNNYRIISIYYDSISEKFNIVDNVLRTCDVLTIQEFKELLSFLKNNQMEGKCI